mmetsp:Transcript_1958/g.5192  ORF Transcript_1958/g.5192 Transcript_1958/m.5192 type:complete len:678 (-) Transcript_1958:452-2485(-)
MKSRITNQKHHDSDRHSHYDTESKAETKEENGTNEQRETSCGIIAKKDSESSTNHHTDHATRDDRDCDEENATADAPSDKNSWYPYFPLNYSVPPHNLHFEHSHYKNWYTGRYYCPPEHYYHSHYHRSRQHPFTSQHSPEYKYKKINPMAPFDDKTAVARNVTKGKHGSIPLTVKTPQTKRGFKQRSDNVFRPPLPEYSVPVPRYDCFYDPHRSHHHQHYKFSDDSTEYDCHNDYDYNYYDSSAATPQRSNQSAVVAERASRKLMHSGDPNQVQYSPMVVFRSSRFEFPEKQKKDATPTDHSSHDQRPHFHPYYSNGWYPDYGYSAQPYPPQPYDEHHFCPSPPPAPPHSLPEYPRQAYPPLDNNNNGNNNESVSRASSPAPPSWYEGRRNDEYNQRRGYAPHQAFPNLAAASYDTASYDDSDPAPEETYTAQEFKDGPETPSSGHNSRQISRVTPQNRTGRKSPETVEINFPSSSTKPNVTPGEKEKTGSSLFPPSSDAVELRDMDIVCGRGAPTNFHYGNDQFRELASRYQTAYFCAKRSEKPEIAMKIMDELQSRGARFVRRQKGGSATKATLEKHKQGSPTLSSHWVEVSAKIAYEKVCQALRDGTHNIQRQMLSSPQRSLGNSNSMSSNSNNQTFRGGKSNIPQLHSGKVNKDGIRTTTEQGKENGDTVHRI